MFSKGQVINNIQTLPHILLSEDIVETSYVDFIVERMSSPIYWAITGVCALIWLLSALPCFRDSDIMHIFKGIAKYSCIVLVGLYLIIRYLM